MRFNGCKTLPAIIDRRHYGARLFAEYRIIDQTPIGIVILTPMRTIRYVNFYAVRIFGSDRRSLLGASIDAFFVDCRGETAWIELWSSVITGREGETGSPFPGPAAIRLPARSPHSFFRRMKEMRKRSHSFSKTRRANSG